jgi:hypothetical protein
MAPSRGGEGVEMSHASSPPPVPASTAC